MLLTNMAFCLAAVDSNINLLLLQASSDDASYGCFHTCPRVLYVCVMSPEITGH